MLNALWVGFVLTAFGAAVVRFLGGDPGIFAAVMQAAFAAAKTAFEVALGLTGVMCLWLGVMKIGERAVRVITQFYRTFHSYRWVREKVVVRIQRALTPAAVGDLNARFDSLLASDRIVQTAPLPEERDETHLAHLSRIVLIPHKKDFGSIRLFLDAINTAETQPT